MTSDRNAAHGTDDGRQAPGAVALAELARELLADVGGHPSGRTARTILSGSSMRAVVIALRDGAELAEHEAPPAATLQVVTGRVRLSAGDAQWRLEAGQVVPIPPVRHSLRAEADSAVLLTVALH